MLRKVRPPSGHPPAPKTEVPAMRAGDCKGGAPDARERGISAPLRGFFPPFLAKTRKGAAVGIDRKVYFPADNVIAPRLLNRTSKNGQ